MLLGKFQYAIDKGEPTLFFLDRRGDLDCVISKEGNREAIVLDLIDQLSASGPNFEICTIVGAEIQNRFGDFISFDDLPEAIKAAEEERTRFYSEREEEYGKSAWPVGGARFFF